MTHNEYYDKQDYSLHHHLGFSSKMEGTPVLQSLAYTDGSLSGSNTWEGNNGGYRECNFTVMVDDAPYIYKTVSRDNRSEHLAYAIDTKLRLNLVPYVRPYVLTLDEIETAYEKTWSRKMPISDTMREFISEELASGGGYFMEFYPHALIDTCDRNMATLNMLLTKEGRYSFMKLYLLDLMTSNRDSRRDVSNWLVSENNDVVAIDNARTGCTSFESYHNRLPEKIVPFSVSNKDIPVPCFFDTGVNKTLKDKPSLYPFIEQVKMMSRSNLEQVLSTPNWWVTKKDLLNEAYSCFLEHWDPESIIEMCVCLGWECSYPSIAIQEDKLAMFFSHSIADCILEELAGVIEFFETYVRGQYHISRNGYSPSVNYMSNSTGRPRGYATRS